MKKTIAIFLSLLIGYAVYWLISDYNYKKDKKENIVGIYTLDIYRTNLGIYKDSIKKYKNLRLNLGTNMTFSLSFSVPFMSDTMGVWKIGSMDEWNKIIYSNGIENQLGREGDYIIYINSATPRISNKGIDKIFFVKTTYKGRVKR